MGMAVTVATVAMGATVQMEVIVILAEMLLILKQALPLLPVEFQELAPVQPAQGLVTPMKPGQLLPM
jgi:hypothetical protein